MGILQEQELGVIGCFPGDVSAYVTDQMGEEAVCFHSDVPSGAGSEILIHILSILPLEGII